MPQESYAIYATRNSLESVSDFLVSQISDENYYEKSGEKGRSVWPVPRVLAFYVLVLTFYSDIIIKSARQKARLCS